MKRSVLGLGIALALCACERHEKADAGGKPAAAAEDAADVAVAPEAARSLITVAAEASQAPRTLRAPGRVLDSATLLDAAGALARAELAASAAARELARTRALARDDANASQRELATAELANAEASTTLAAARARAAASFGLADAARIAALAAGLARGELAIGRIELPPGAPAPGSRDALLVSTPTLGGEPQRARFIALAGALDPSLQGGAVLVALGPNPPPVGAALEATLEVGAAQPGVWLPESAVVWNDGDACAFVAGEPGHFVRRALGGVRRLREGYFVAQGVAPGERVVASGAQQLLSAQRVGSEAEED